MVLKVQDAIFDESNHIKRVTIHATDDNDLPDLWVNESTISIIPLSAPAKGADWTNDSDLPFSSKVDCTIQSQENTEKQQDTEMQNDKMGTVADEQDDKDEEDEDYYAPRDFERGPWLNPETDQCGHGR